ncbi:potentiating neddylation domain-containing protein [Parasitella parasitica]|nr:potentiating neddylation domain-containing protein [Parasitella parasitica]
MYKYTFSYAKNRDQKCMDIETASVLWTMLLGEKYPIVHDFVLFLQEKKPVRVINRDQWQSFLEFASTDVSKYDESSACRF